MNILVSQCLLGVPCRYDGASKPLEGLSALEQAGHTLIPVCPEVLGGLPTPRTPAERQDGRVVTQDGADVTEAYRLGAEAAVKLARKHGCQAALLKERSPSCGVKMVYDGTFSRRLIPGKGVAAQALSESGVLLCSEEELPILLAALSARND